MAIGSKDDVFKEKIEKAENAKLIAGVIKSAKLTKKREDQEKHV